MRYRFDQIAVNVKEKKKPVEEDKRYYIGLEHLDSGSLSISRWGADVAPKGEKLLMQKGDVLFGKRRAYQKKVAIAPFDGIFSAHGMVLRPNEEIVDKDFFPMFISSDYFLDAANALSVGSLSPTINWRDLARAEFELPPMEKQRELGQLLWVMEDAKVEYQRLLAVTDELVKSRFVEMFGDLRTNPYGWDIQTFDKLTDLITDGEHNTPQRSKNGIFLLSARNILNHHIQLDDVDYIDKEEYNRISRRIIPRKGDVLISCSGTVGRCCSVSTDLKFQMVRSVALLRFKPVFNPLFAEYMITSKYIQEQINSSKTASSQANLFQSKIAKLKGALPPLSLQNEFATFVEQTDKSKFDQLGRSSSCLTKTILRKK